MRLVLERKLAKYHQSAVLTAPLCGLFQFTGHHSDLQCLALSLQISVCCRCILHFCNDCSHSMNLHLNAGPGRPDAAAASARQAREVRYLLAPCCPREEVLRGQVMGGARRTAVGCEASCQLLVCGWRAAAARASALPLSCPALCPPGPRSRRASPPDVPRCHVMVSEGWAACKVHTECPNRCESGLLADTSQVPHRICMAAMAPMQQHPPAAHSRPHRRRTAESSIKEHRCLSLTNTHNGHRKEAQRQLLSSMSR